MPDDVPAEVSPRLLTKMTLTYDAEQDRISLAGEATNDTTVRLWLTLRLLTRLTPHLVKAFRQQQSLDIGKAASGAATSSGDSPVAGNTPVTVTDGSDEYLVKAVDVKESAEHIVLTLRGFESGEVVRFAVPFPALEPWLQGMKRCFERAEWPMESWAGFQPVTPEGEIGTHTLH